MDLPSSYLVQFVTEIEARYVSSSKSGKTRFARYQNSSECLRPLSQEYEAFEEQMRTIASNKGCEPNVLIREDFPHFAWYYWVTGATWSKLKHLWLRRLGMTGNTYSLDLQFFSRVAHTLVCMYAPIDDAAPWIPQRLFGRARGRRHEGQCRRHPRS